MRFALPHMLWLLILLPVIGFYFYWAFGFRRGLAQRFATAKALQRFRLMNGHIRYWLQATLMLVGFACLVVALARPQWGFHERRVISKGVDMVVAIDTSNSMLARDLKPDRVTRAKELLRNLIWEAQGSRVGVVAFAGRAVVMCPLTLDYNMANTTLKAIDISTVSAGGTNIAAAIESAISAFEISGGNDRVLVLLTDGEQTEELDQLKMATEKAAKEGVRIFAIAIGTKEGGQIPTLRGPKRDSNNNVITTKMNMDQLEDIAEATKGITIRAEQNGASEIAEISAELAKFKGEKKEDKSVRVYHERYPIFLGVAFFCFLLEPLMRYGGGRMLKRGDKWKNSVAAMLLGAGVLLMAPGGAMAYPGESFMRAREAYQKYNSGDYDPAMELYREARDLKPNDALLQYNLGATAARAKKYDEAKAAFRSVYDPENPILNADALFGAASIEHHELRDKIKASREGWRAALLESASPDKDAMGQVKETLAKLKDVSGEYKSAIMAKPDDENMKANYELLLKDIEELEKLLKAAQDKQEQQQQDQKNQDNEQKDQEKKPGEDKPEDGKNDEGKQGDQQGQQKDEKESDKGKDEEQNKKDGEQKQDEKKDNTGEQSDEKKPDQGESQKSGEQKDENGKPDDKQPPKATPTPSPTPGNKQQQGPGKDGDNGQAGGKPDAQGTPVPIGQMSPSDVDRLLNTLPSEDQQALQLMFMQPTNPPQDMKNDW